VPESLHTEEELRDEVVVVPQELARLVHQDLVRGGGSVRRTT
jgi:hypothetical protein